MSLRTQHHHYVDSQVSRCNNVRTSTSTILFFTTKVFVMASGGGIGGIALAVTIGRYSNLPVDIYEAGPEITTVGAGISVWRRTWEVMKMLGLDEELANKAIEPPKETGGQ